MTAVMGGIIAAAGLIPARTLKVLTVQTDGNGAATVNVIDGDTHVPVAENVMVAKTGTTLTVANANANYKLPIMAIE